MSDLLVELLSEEIPARMQTQAAHDLQRLVTGALTDRGLLYEGAKAYAGPRRLVLDVRGLPASQPDVREEKKGPRVKSPQKAIEGFLRSAGVSLEDCEKRDDGKGEFYVAVIAREGRPASEVLPEALPEAIARLTWPKSMRWGTAGQTRWVRPLHAIVCTLDGEPIAFSFAGIASGNATRGHRFLSKGPVVVHRFDDYEKKLRAAHVILDAGERKEIIRHDTVQKAFALGLELIEDEDLLDEVAGLTEWPVVLIGTIEAAFMELPAEVLRSSMRTHQKYFTLRHAATGKLSNRFAFAANMIVPDGGKEIVRGNERVLRSRLADAKFFWEQDRKTRLEDRVNALAGIVFHAELGTQLDHVKAVEELSAGIARHIGADVAKARRAARLCKADLTSEVVGEFPDLQGVMGRYYALHDGEDAEVADAIRDHYKPQGPNDSVPKAPVTVTLALADKLYALFAFFGIDERPSGSGDPYALRRAALGALRIILENGLRIDIQKFGDAKTNGLLEFLVDRLKVVLRARGLKHDVLDAVFSIHRDADFVRLVALSEATQAFIKFQDGANLLVAYRRAANILKAEEKKDRTSYDGPPDPDALLLAEEKTLFTALATVSAAVSGELVRERFGEAMTLMASLRLHIDLFFDKVTVNAPEARLRQNRLLLLSRIRSTLHLIADFSKIDAASIA